MAPTLPPRKRPLGSPASLALICWLTAFSACLIARGAWAQSTYKFDFGAATYTATGYVAVDNTAAYTAARGYGWLSTTNLSVRDRGVPDDALRRDFVFATSASTTFRLSGVTPGKYLMKIICGDASYGDHVTTVSVPNAGTLPTISPRNGEFLMLSASVTVSSTGVLDLTLGSPSSNWVINALTLEPTTTDITPVIESANVSEWNAAVFATDPTAPLLSAFVGNAATGVSSTGLTRADYLKLIGSEIDFWKARQNSSGAIIDPYANSEIQLVVYANRTDLVETAAKAMDWATARLHVGAAANGHNDFYPGMLAHGLTLLQPYVTTSRWSTWAANLNFDPYSIYAYAPGTINWNVVSSSGEALLHLLGIRPDNNYWVTESWGAQGRHFNSPYGLYEEGPMAYDHFPRIWLEDALARGYTGAYSTEVRQAMDRAAIASLFMQSPWGELPAGGRSAHHQWNEAEQCVTYEIYASKAKAAGDTRLAAAYKRAAHLAFSSMQRWVRPTGEMQILKNWVTPSSRYGYESYSYHSQYNLLPMAMLSMAYEFAAPSEDVAERTAPADTGGFVFQLANLHKIFANAGGCYVEIDTSADHNDDATGLIRVHKKGVPPQLGPSDSLLTAAAYNTPVDSTVITGVGVAWQDSSAVWHTLGEMDSTEITSTTLTPLVQTPARVTFDVTYTGSMAGVATVIEHYTVTPAGVQLTTELPGYTGALRYVWPVLSNDGQTQSTISVSGNTVTVAQGSATPQTFRAPGAASVRVETTDFSNHNGYARLGVAEFPTGGIVTLLIGTATPSALTAGTLYVDLRATAASGAGTATWLNGGTLGSFSAAGAPSLVTNAAGTGVPGVLFNGTSDAYTSLSLPPADLTGSSDRSIEAWVYNPAIGAEESLVSWGRRSATRANLSLNYGANTTYGAVTHYNDNLAWTTVPAAGAWHHLAYVYSGSTDARVYVDGVLSKSKTLGGVLATTATDPINVGAQRASGGTLAADVYFSGYLNTVRVHGGALSAAQVAANYALGLAAAPPAAPTLGAVASQTLSFNTASDQIPLTVADTDSAVSGLTLSAASANPALIPAGDIVFGGSNASRSVTLTPAANATGTTTVTLTVSDGAQSASQTFSVTVLTPSQTWQQQNFGANANNPAIAGDQADPDGDGLSNLLEYSLGTNPNQTNAGAAPQTSVVNGKLALAFTRNAAAVDLIVSVLGADSLAGPWTELARSTGGAAFAGSVAGVAVSEGGTGTVRTVQVSDVYQTNDPAHPSRFLKVQAAR